VTAPSADLRAATCPACGHHVAVTFLTSDAQPLATIAWPDSSAKAKAMTRLPLDFVSCVACGHVYNVAFTYEAVPYSEKPNLMFNRGGGWTGHLRQVLDDLVRRLPPKPVVVEVGYGDGSFIAALAERRPDGTYHGFDPHGCQHAGDLPITFHADLFQPGRDLPALRPDLIISRHVLEHLTNPLGFMQQMAFAAALADVSPALFIEVPCIDAALSGRRTVDFYYEHNSQFTTESFTRMLTRCAATVETIGHGYHGEVIYGYVRLGGPAEHVRHAEAAAAFRTATTAALATVRAQLAALDGQRTVIWGGTGKSAAFMNRYGVDADRFPWVVDSDDAKVGTFVPGQGQEIRSLAWLQAHGADVAIIPPQWRARDIEAEMTEAGLTIGTLLIEHGGTLVDLRTGDHPY
jgi:hypothetical protein